jgi:hypothetical protein
VEQCFGGNAADQKTGSTKPRLALDQGSFQAVLASADGCRITSRTAANYDYVICHFRLKCSSGNLFSRQYV